MAIGDLLSNARKRQGMTQEDLAADVNYSREAIAKYETGARKLPKELYQEVTLSVDDPQFYFETWEAVSGVVSIPYFDGDYIDRHPASMHYLVRKETTEALEQLNSVCWVKPANVRTDDEREEMKKVLMEVLDAAASMINLVACVCKEYRFSMKDIFRAWNVTMKIRKFNK